MVSGALLKFGKRYDNNLRVIFDQLLKLDLGLDDQKILKGTYLLNKKYSLQFAKYLL